MNDFLKKQLPYFSKIAWRWSKTGPDSKTMNEDLVSIISEVAFQLIEEYIADPQKLSKLKNWSYEVQNKVGNPVRTHLHSEAGLAPASKMSGVIIRRIQMSNVREQLRKDDGTEPTDQMVIDATNAEMSERRKDLDKQGLRVSHQDIALGAYAAHIDSQTELVGESGLFTDDFVLHPSEGRAIVEEIVAAAEATNERLGEVARAWVGDMYPSGGDLLKQSEIAARLGMPKQRVNESMREIKEIAREVLTANLDPEDYL